MSNRESLGHSRAEWLSGACETAPQQKLGVQKTQWVPMLAEHQYSLGCLQVQTLKDFPERLNRNLCRQVLELRIYIIHFGMTEEQPDLETVFLPLFSP